MLSAEKKSMCSGHSKDMYKITIHVLALTDKVFPRPIQWAKMQPDPSSVLDLLTDSNVQSQTN